MLMKDNQNTAAKHNTSESANNDTQLVTDFGERSVHEQNFSKVVALPKVALANCGNISHVNVKLVQENGEKYLKLTPVQKEERN